MMKMKWTTAFCMTVAFLGSLAWAVPCAVAQEPEEALTEAWSLLNEGKLKQAVKAFEKLDKSTEGAERAVLGLAMANYRLGRYEKSLALARRLLEQPRDRSTEMDALHLLGVSLYWTGPEDPKRLEEAERALRRVIELHGEVSPAAEAMYGLAKVLQALGREPEAIGILRKILAEDIDPDRDPTPDAARILNCQLRQSLGYQNYPVPKKPGSGAPTEARPVDPSEVQPPVKLLYPNPPYPAEVRRRRLEGVVAAQIIVDEEGCATQVKIMSAFTHEVEELSEETFRRWVFRPARLNGAPVAIYYSATSSMRLK